jgi:hypothetical protein
MIGGVIRTGLRELAAHSVKGWFFAVGQLAGQPARFLSNCLPALKDGVRRCTGFGTSDNFDFNFTAA